MKYSGITKRWAINTLLVVLLILVAIATILFIILHMNYYETVNRKLKAQYSDSVANFFNSYTGDTNEKFKSGAMEFVENYTEKDSVEVCVIDKNGKLCVSSNGFGVEGNNNTSIPDYEIALNTKSRVGQFIGKNENNEKIMAMTFLLPPVEGQNTGAVRYIISLKKIDKQLMKLVLTLVLVIVIIIGLVSISGLFFIQSIVNPVRKINETAKRIAKGDWEARVETSENNDEINELCKTFNYMATEISKTDRMKNDFISTVSHEMRTPLTAIKGWGETILQMNNSDPKLTKRGIEVIIGESTRLNQVVEDLLDLSRLMNGGFKLRIQKIDVLAELDDAEFVFKDRSNREGIELIYNVPHIPAPMDGDSNRIKQVFVNILDNAFKYTKQGGKISVSAEINDIKNVEDKCNLDIHVQDTGCGIKREDLPHIKEKFYKTNITVKGTGIGLAVCDEIMKMHNGNITIQSEENVGTTVTLSFVVDKVEIPEEQQIPLIEEGEQENEQ